MSTRYYDVVVLGRSLGALAAGALLARRDFRVLLLGQGQRPPSYRFDRHALRRRTFTLLAAATPAWKRILHELAQSPTFRRRTVALDPMFVVMWPERRVEVPPDLELFAREIDREFPEVRQLVDEVYAAVAQVNAAADAAFERDAVWPPGTLWERIETGRAASSMPLAESGAQHELLAKFPTGHPFRDLVLLPALFASDLATPIDQVSGFALARLHGAWTRGIQALPGGADELEEFLIERIEAHGGECHLERRSQRILVRRGALAGMLLDGDDEPVGTGAVVADASGETLADLAGGEGITKRARSDWPRLTASVGRFVTSLVVRTAGLPAALGAEAFLVPGDAARPDPRLPVVHLQRFDRELVEGAPAETLLVAETLMAARGPLSLLDARDATLRTLREQLPFLERHLLVADSPHDGLPLHEYSSGARREIGRVHVAGTSPAPEPMEWLWTAEPPGYLGISGEPVRGPIPGTYLVGKTVLPALGPEGELLAAWGAARAITRGDRARQRMRRQMWSKIET
jgi:hypothetical protein